MKQSLLLALVLLPCLICAGCGDKAAEETTAPSKNGMTVDGKPAPPNADPGIQLGSGPEGKIGKKGAPK